MAHFNNRLDNYLEGFNKKNRLNIFVASLGILFFVFVAVILPFKYNLFSQLYQKVFTHAATLGNGDANSDGSVNGNDLKFVAQNVGGTVTGALDQYSDGKINGFDFAQVAFIIQNPPTPTPTPGNGSPTPTAAPSTGEWTQFGHDAQHTDFTAQVVTTPWQYKWQWNGAGADGKQQAGHLSVPSYVQPTTGGGRVYMVAANSIYALNSTNGSVLWTRGSIGTLSGTPIYDQENIYIASGDSHIYKINASTGVVISSFTGASAFSLSPLLANGNLYAVADTGVLYSVNASTMAQNWTYTGGSPGVTAPAYSTSRNIVIFLTQDLNVHAVNIANGLVKWKVKPTSRVYQCKVVSGSSDSCNLDANGAQANGGWPVIAEQHGIVFIRYRLDWNTLWTWNPYPTTNAAIRADLQSQPLAQPLYALSLDTGASSFIPAVGNGGAGDGGTLPMGPQPVIRNLGNGQEVAYIIWRNGLTCAASFCDGREDATMGEMVLDNTTVSGYQAGDVRFVKFIDIQTDEMLNLTMSNDIIVHNHWLDAEAYKITDRSAGLGATYTSPINTTPAPNVIWRQVYCASSNSQCNPQNFPGGTGFSYGPADCPFDATHRYCSQELYSYGDQRSYPPGFYEYWNDSNSGSTAFTIFSNNQVLIKTYDGGLIALQNGNPLGLAGSEQTIAEAPKVDNSVLGTQTESMSQYLATHNVPVIGYQDASKYLGQIVTVEGTIASAVNHLPKAIYLGFQKPHDGALLMRVFNKDLNKFNYDPMTLNGKKIKVTGFVTLYWPAGIDPEIIVTNPDQIEVEK